MGQRPYSFAILGATGFTGRGVLRYLQGRFQDSVDWAIVGRDRPALEALAADFPQDRRPGVIVVSQLSPASIAELVAQTRLLVNLAGPYGQFGDGLVAACVDNDTHYIDICGELDVIANCVSLHHTAAQEKQLRIIPGAGFESLVFDIASRVAVEALGSSRQEQGPMLTVLFSMLNAANSYWGEHFSPGTVATGIDTLERKVPLDLLLDPFCLTPEPKDPARQEPNRLKLDAWYDSQRKVWCAPLLPGPFMNRAMVHRTNYLLAQVGEGYGEGFSYQEAMNVSAVAPWPWGQSLAANSVAALARRFVAALGDQGGTDRKAMLGYLKYQARLSALPNDAQLDKLGYQLDIEATGRDAEIARVCVRGVGHPGYRSTSNMLAEAILALVKGSNLSDIYGVITPAVAFGTHFLPRLKEAGVTVHSF